MISTTSTSSNTSTLSNLSNLSEMETNPQTKSKKKNQSFAIDGIEHNLLSRGKTDRTEFSQYEHPKITKRKQKSRTKAEGGGRDIFGLKQEGVMTRLLYNLGDITAVSITVGELCESLLIVGGITFQLLACEVSFSFFLLFSCYILYSFVYSLFILYFFILSYKLQWILILMLFLHLLLQSLLYILLNG